MTHYMNKFVQQNKENLLRKKYFFYTIIQNLSIYIQLLLEQLINCSDGLSISKVYHNLKLIINLFRDSEAHKLVQKIFYERIAYYVFNNTSRARRNKNTCVKQCDGSSLKILKLILSEYHENKWEVQYINIELLRIDVYNDYLLKIKG